MDEYRVPPGTTINLPRLNPADTNGTHKGSIQDKLQDDLNALAELQELHWVAATHGILIVLQGIDASGKDGTVRHVMSAFNPAGTRVISFKQPSVEELSHDYLWRIHKAAPARGEIAIFNRSHYESVIVERVHKLVPEAVWRPRYQQINDFEHMLTLANTIVFKFFLHISPEEQYERLRARIDDPSKWWKLSPTDWQDRARWDEMEAAYNEMLTKTSTDYAPWYIVPADKKWYRNLVVARTIRERLEPMRQPWKDAIARLGTARKAEVDKQLEGIKDTLQRVI